MPRSRLRLLVVAVVLTLPGCIVVTCGTTRRVEGERTPPAAPLAVLGR